jgi:hypothetical protein
LVQHVHAARRVAACGAIVAAALGLGACGGGSSSSSNAGQPQQQAGRGAFLRDPKVLACLKKQGVTLPTFRRPQNGQAPNGQPPANRPRRNRDSAQFQKLRAALQKCGVTLPNGGGPGGGPPPNQGTTTTNAT